MKPTLIISLVSVALITNACKQPKKPTHYNNLISGEWKCIETKTTPKKTASPSTLEPPPPRIHFLSATGYNFKPDGICENKLGYFRRNHKTGDKSSFTFLGNITKYSIEDDSLKIYNLATGIWESSKIYDITPDTLILQLNDRTFSKYAKLHFKKPAQPSFDQIVISSCGCECTCPINDVLMNNRGTFIFHGRIFNDVEGYYSSRLTKEQFEGIVTNFEKADFLNLKDDYYRGGVDAESVNVCFIKNNRIIKTINDYSNNAPDEFYWAYTPARFLYQQLKLIPIKNENSDDFKFTVNCFKTKDKICEIYESESFFLCSCLQNSKETKVPFHKKYEVGFWESSLLKSIESDGRYFRLTSKNGKQRVQDLGYNFIEVNGFEKRFRNLTKYDEL